MSLLALLVELLDPVARLDEQGGLGDVVHHERRLGLAVVHGRQQRKPLLARSVPDLVLDGAVVDGAFLGEERGANGGLLVLLEVVQHKAEHKQRLPDGGFPEKHEFDQIHPCSAWNV